MIVPIATELPEKVNAILWIRKHKDTLAFGNITPAQWCSRAPCCPPWAAWSSPWPDASLANAPKFFRGMTDIPVDSPGCRRFSEGMKPT
jgi:hypothetical protein